MTLNLHATYNGKEFNELTKDKIFLKFLNEQENHNEMQYQTGLNVDILPFNSSGECSKGGLYFCELKYGHKYLVCWPIMRRVTIPDDALVYVEEKFKTNNKLTQKIGKGIRKGPHQ